VLELGGGAEKKMKKFYKNKIELQQLRKTQRMSRLAVFIIAKNRIIKKFGG